MFQCVGLGTTEQGGCNEDWWHAECIMGLSRNWHSGLKKENGKIEGDDKLNSATMSAELPAIEEETADATNGTSADNTTELAEVQPGEEAAPDHEEAPVPPGFPDEDSFEHFICYKCSEAFPWIKRYAGTTGFLPGVSNRGNKNGNKNEEHDLKTHASAASVATDMTNAEHAMLPGPVPGKRKVDDDEEEILEITIKRSKTEDDATSATQSTTDNAFCKYEALPAPTTAQISLFLTADFRSHLCRCPKHYPLLIPHPQLLEEEESYEPPMSEGSSVGGGAPSTHGSRSLLDRGEAALSTMDRVRAIEGVMVYNHLRDKVKDFLKPFAESGRAVGAEDVKAYFEQLRGDEDVMRSFQGGGGDEDADDSTAGRGTGS